ncbi:MAG: amidohydrolase [Deltaproteobacteria bacterium]|nr:amidohydrolase [Deltaproteobacteria bacterium]MBI2991389.1 amidohydrolase [Deltaproteobacteria bacterium]
MTLLIEHVLLVTLNDQNQIIGDGALVVDGRRLSYVGPAAKAPSGSFDRVIDGSRFIAIPGLVNAHCHSPANLFRGLFAASPLEIWRIYWRAALRPMTGEDFYASALLGAMEMLKTGATTVLDHFFGNQAVPFMGAGEAIRAMRDIGLRHVVALTIADKSLEETVPLEKPAAGLLPDIRRMSRSETREGRAWLEECESFISEHHDPEKMTTCCPGPSGVQRCTDGLLKGAAEIARRMRLPLHMHLAETKSQKVMGRRLYGTSLLRHLESIGALGPNLSLAHSIWIEESDVELFAGSGATAVHNPASNLRLGSGLAPLPQFLAAGVHVALGTDGATSNDGQNMFDAIRLATLIHNPRSADFKKWTTPPQALRMATREGARALGLEAGMLAPGKLADLVLLRSDTPAFTPLNNVLHQLALCENGSSVDTVIVDGEVVVEGGRLAKMREEEVLGLAAGSLKRLRPGIEQEIEASRALEPALAEMYFRVARES